MALPKKKFREILFQALFSREFSSESEEALIPFMMRELKITKGSVRAACGQVAQIQEHAEAFDSLLAKHSLEYGVERIPKAERAILHLALFELFHETDIPPKVVLSEAVRLTRKYATRDSARFVNALLDAVYKNDVPASV